MFEFSDEVCFILFLVELLNEYFTFEAISFSLQLSCLHTSVNEKEKVLISHVIQSLFSIVSSNKHKQRKTYFLKSIYEIAGRMMTMKMLIELNFKMCKQSPSWRLLV